MPKQPEEGAVFDGALLMDDGLRGLLAERIRRVCLGLAKKGQFLIIDAANQVIAEMMSEDNTEWIQIRNYFAQRGIARHLNKILAQARASNSDQAVLPFDEFEPVEGLEALPQIVTSDGAAVLSRDLLYAEYDAQRKRLERRIKSYEYKRRKPENLQQDIELLKQMTKFNPRFAQYSKDDPDLPLWKAKALELSQSSARPNRKPKRAKEKR